MGVTENTLLKTNTRSTTVLSCSVFFLAREVLPLPLELVMWPPSVLSLHLYPNVIWDGMHLRQLRRRFAACRLSLVTLGRLLSFMPWVVWKEGNDFGVGLTL
jgi:hypothetical protein